jgi:hypothetical protein
MDTKFLFENLKWKIAFGTSRCRWEDSIKHISRNYGSRDQGSVPCSGEQGCESSGSIKGKKFL